MMLCEPRKRILDAATKLFCERGIQAVGVDTIVSEAGVALTTLCRQFGGKDQLVAATLEQWSANWLHSLNDLIARSGDDPKRRFEALWEALDSWLASEELHSSFAANVATELHSMPDHPAHKVLMAHRRAMRRLLEDLAHRAGAHDPLHMAGQLQVLADGANAVVAAGHPLDVAGVRALANAALAAGSR